MFLHLHYALRTVPRDLKWPFYNNSSRCKDDSVITWLWLPVELLVARETASQRSPQRQRWEQGSDQWPQFPVHSWWWWQTGSGDTSGSGKGWILLAPGLWIGSTVDSTPGLPWILGRLASWRPIAPGRLQSSQQQQWGQGTLCSWASSNIYSLPWNLFPAIIAGPLPRSLITCWSTAREGLNTQWRPAVGQPGHQACHPATLSCPTACPC